MSIASPPPTNGTPRSPKAPRGPAPAPAAVEPPPASAETLELLAALAVTLARGRGAPSARLVGALEAAAALEPTLAEAALLIALLIRSRGGLPAELDDRLGELLRRGGSATTELRPAAVVAALEARLAAEPDARIADALRRLGIAIINFGGLQGPPTPELVEAVAGRIEALTIEVLAPLDRLAFDPAAPAELQRRALETPSPWPLLRTRRLRPNWVAGGEASALALEIRAQLEARSPLGRRSFQIHGALAVGLGLVLLLTGLMSYALGRRHAPAPQRIVERILQPPTIVEKLVTPPPPARPGVPPDFAKLPALIPAARSLLVVRTFELPERSDVEFRTRVVALIGGAFPAAEGAPAEGTAAVARPPAILEYADLPIAARVPAEVLASPRSGRVLKMMIARKELGTSPEGILIVRRLADEPDRAGTTTARLAFDVTTDEAVAAAPDGAVPLVFATTGEMSLPDLPAAPSTTPVGALTLASHFSSDTLTAPLVAESLLAAGPESTRAATAAAALYLRLGMTAGPPADVKEPAAPAGDSPFLARATSILRGLYQRGRLDNHNDAESALALRLLVALSPPPDRAALFAAVPALTRDPEISRLLGAEGQTVAEERTRQLAEIQNVWITAALTARPMGLPR